MLKRLRKGGAIALALALAIFGLGFANTALADDEAVATYSADDALLTKVIVAPENTDATDDTYTFHFEGNGEVRDGVTDQGEDRDKLYSADGIEQDSRTIQKGDTIPAIADYPVNGVTLTFDNSLSNGQSFQAVVQTKISDILAAGNVTFPHAGVYTYRVTESTTSTQLSNQGYYINPSKAAYILRVRVVNNDATQTPTSTDPNTRVDSVTLERELNDNGEATDIGKVDPTYPTTTATGKIDHEKSDKVPAANTLAGDNADRGRDVYGFTFANEYVKGGQFQVKKLVSGTYGDKTKLFRVKLTIHDAASTAPDSQGCCVTYQIEGDGVDQTDNVDTATGARRTLNGVPNVAQASHNIAIFDSETGNAVIEADLKEGSIIRVTGVFGPYSDSYTGSNGEKRMILSTAGLLAGETYKVEELTPGSYDPTGYVYVGEDTTVDPRVSSTGMDSTAKNGDGQLVLTKSATGSATTVFVVNNLEDSNASPTGIFIDNLPYILMVAVPVAVFAVMFVNKRRGNAAA